MLEGNKLERGEGRISSKVLCSGDCEIELEGRPTSRGRVMGSGGVIGWSIDLACFGR